MTVITMILYANAFAYQKNIIVDTTNIGISYDISGGDLVRASLDRAGHTLYLTLEKTSDGSLSITIPDGLIPVDMSHGEQPAFSIMVGRNEANFKVQGNSTNIPFHKGDTSISITETPIIPLEHSSSSQSNPMINSDTVITQQSQISTIPKWVKNNAKWWSENQIDDTDFLKGIQYLVLQKIIQIPSTQVSSSSSQSVPQWIKESAAWWANGQLSDHEFIQSIQWLIQQNIVVIPPVQTSSQQTTTQLDQPDKNVTFVPSQSNSIHKSSIENYFPTTDNIGQMWNISNYEGSSFFVDEGASQGQSKFYENDAFYLPHIEEEIGQFSSSTLASSALDKLTSHFNQQSYQPVPYQPQSNSANCYASILDTPDITSFSIQCQNENIAISVVSQSTSDTIAQNWAKEFINYTLNKISK